MKSHIILAASALLMSACSSVRNLSGSGDSYFAGWLIPCGNKYEFADCSTGTVMPVHPGPGVRLAAGSPDKAVFLEIEGNVQDSLDTPGNRRAVKIVHIVSASRFDGCSEHPLVCGLYRWYESEAYCILTLSPDYRYTIDMDGCRASCGSWRLSRKDTIVLGPDNTLHDSVRGAYPLTFRVMQQGETLTGYADGKGMLFTKEYIR